MNTLEYYFPQRGEDIYYACIHLPVPLKKALFTLEAFWRQIMSVSEKTTQEAHIAELKLNWWREEIQQIYVGTPTHPITQALVDVVHLYQIRQSQLTALAEAAQLSINTQIFETQASLNKHYQHLGGIRYSLFSKILLKEAPSVTLEKMLHHYGIASEIIRHLQNFAHFLARKQLYIPLEALPEKEHTAYEILNGKYEILPNLLAQQASLAGKLFEEFPLKNLPEQLAPIHNEIRLHQAHLHLLKRKKYPILATPLQILPIRKLLICQ